MAPHGISRHCGDLFCSVDHSDHGSALVAPSSAQKPKDELLGSLHPQPPREAFTSFHQYGKWYPPEMKERKRFGYEVMKREQVPLCSDLRPGVLFEGEKCWSKCGLPGEEDCMPRVMTLPEEGSFEMVKHPVCQSHVECVGKPRRVLCEVAKKGSWQENLMTRMASLPAFAAVLRPSDVVQKRPQGRQEKQNLAGYEFL